MMRSMNSAVSSLKNHQVRMDVIGNNIANVNTVAFKAGRTTFKDTYSQLVRTSSGHTESRGGINPGQVGLGMNISSIDNAMEKGTIDTTNIGTDLYIDGEGFFLVDSPDGRYYTRDGNMSIDEEGYLTNQSGMFLMGYQTDKDGNVIEKLDRIKVPLKDIVKPNVTGRIGLEGNLNSKAGEGIPKDDNYPTDLVGDKGLYDERPVDPTDPTKGNIYTLKKQYSDNSTDKRVSIVGKSLNTEIVDSLGGKHSIKFDFVKGKDPNTWDVYAFYVSPQGAMIPAVAGDPNSLSSDPATATGGNAGKANSEPIVFTDRGLLAGDALKQLKFSFNPSTINGAAPSEFTLDLSKLTQYEKESDVIAKENDGYTAGSLSGMTIGSDGKVIGKFSNGDNKVLAQIVTATFANVNGLKKEGDNLWTPTQNSGDPNINKPGSGGNGLIQSGALEGSNVDLAKEFTNMIVTQRGFQANSRVITTTDQMLEELVNLKR